jgi:hypothetical protein
MLLLAFQARQVEAWSTKWQMPGRSRRLTLTQENKTNITIFMSRRNENDLQLQFHASPVN